MRTVLRLLAWMFFAGVVAPAFAADVTLYSGGFRNLAGERFWESHGIGTFDGDSVLVHPIVTAPVGEFRHAEAQLAGFLGTDFDYSADMDVRAGVEMHLQFRVSGEGRYGVRLRQSGISLYEVHLQPKGACSNVVPGAITHCPNWPANPGDLPDFTLLCAANSLGHPSPPGAQCDETPLALAVPSIHRVAIHASGGFINVQLDGVTRFNLFNDDFAVGRFGIYEFGASDAAIQQSAFYNVRVSTDPLVAHNFALLYNTPGYDLLGTKRALVRTINDIPDSVNLTSASRFTVQRTDGGRGTMSGTLTKLGKTFGMQLWEADFSSIVDEGPYTLNVQIIASGGPGSGLVTALQSAPFEIRPNFISNKLLRPLSLANAEARRGADEDFWRNWISETGAWHVGVDGAFIADHADAGAGHTLTRVFNINNEALIDSNIRQQNFRFVGKMTVVSGCDAQMRFEDSAGGWYAVTLQAGDAGGCLLRGGPGALRLSREDAHGFVPLVTTLFPPEHPFLVGHPYDIEILVQGGFLSVYVDAVQGIPEQLDISPMLTFEFVGTRSGRFGLKAFASTARFEDVQAWKDTVQFVPLVPGSARVTTFRNHDEYHHSDLPVACQYSPLICIDDKGDFNFAACIQPVVTSSDPNNPYPEKHDACNPIFAQLHGFHDSSSQVAEATSHGAFLAGLMNIWQNRAASFSQVDRESLRRAIVANVLYMETLFNSSGTFGQIAHSEMGRVGVDGNLGAHQTADALYGLSAFADAGSSIDRKLADTACGHSLDASQWLLPDMNSFNNPTLASLIYARLARCLARYDPILVPTYRIAAFAQAKQVLLIYSDPALALIRNLPRDTGNVVPWFEGVFEVLRSFPPAAGSTDAVAFSGQLKTIAQLLVSHLTTDHPCSDNPLGLVQCAANGFNVIPQASGVGTARTGGTIASDNWTKMDIVPSAKRAEPKTPDLHSYNVQGHFPTAATDAVLLGRMVADPNLVQADQAWRNFATKGLERIATGNLYWPIGLNPGIPTSKIVSPIANSNPWQAASFLYRQNSDGRLNGGAFARAQDGFRIESYTSKGWLDPWEDSVAFPGGNSRHREAWRIDPQNRFYAPPLRSFMSFVNGHMLFDNQWDYWNTGENGWLSGETFIIADGLFLKAGILREDWLGHTTSHPDNPYNTARLAFFDTTHFDRFQTGWGFDDPDWILPAFASRAATNFCNDKGFAGGRFTGHHLDERLGALCVPNTARFYDVTADQIHATTWDFTDIDTTPWAQVSRAATGFCNANNFIGGFFTGHQLNGLHGVICLGADVAHWFDSTNTELYNSGEGFVDINTVPWAKAARAATNICLGRNQGYAGGFFTGHQLNGLHGVVCLTP